MYSTMRTTITTHIVTQPNLRDSENQSSLIG